MFISIANLKNISNEIISHGKWEAMEIQDQYASRSKISPILSCMTQCGHPNSRLSQEFNFFSKSKHSAPSLELIRTLVKAR